MALKFNGAGVWESQRAIGNKASALEGRAHNLTHSTTLYTQSNLKGALVRTIY